MTDKAPTTEPRTQAGRSLLAEYEPGAIVAGGSIEEYILAIEAEAATLDAERDAMKGVLHGSPHTHEQDGSIRWLRATPAETGLREALEEIKREQGKVCADFEVCTHVACRSSYSSWAIADTALSEERP